jgi:hypothetical protein
MSDQEIMRHLADGKGVNEIAKLAGCSSSAISQRKKKLTPKTHDLMDVQHRALVTKQDMDARQVMVDLSKKLFEDIAVLEEQQQSEDADMSLKQILETKIKQYTAVLSQIKAMSEITLSWDQEAHRREKETQKKLFRFIWAEVLDEDQRHKVRGHMQKLNEMHRLESYDG